MGKIRSAISSFFGRVGTTPSVPKRVWAVILAGGSSTRMGGDISKQWLTLDGLPVIVRTLAAFDRAKTVSDILLVVRAEEKELYGGIAEKYGIGKLRGIAIGGDSRQASAKNGFSAVANKADMVAIHDGARCLITPEDIDRVVSEAAKHGAATAAAKGVDTVKLGTANGFIEKTLDRNHVWMAQTPQVFRTNVYHAALAIAERDGITVTDDCSLAEHIEHPVRLVECSRDNIKLTTKDDIARAEAILRARTEEDRT